MSQAPAGRPLRVTWDAAGLSEASCCRLELVDEGGRPVATGQTAEAAVRAEWRLPPLEPGKYWLRLYALPPEQSLLREFGLQVR